LGKVVGTLLNEVTEDGLIVVADQKDFLNLGYFGNSSKAVLDYGVAGDVEERLDSLLLPELVRM
jgi:hypothetical protein